MEKIDRLGWAAGISIVSYGVRVGIRTNYAGVIDQLRKHFPPGWKVSESQRVESLYSLLVGGASGRPNVRRFNILYLNSTRIVRSLDLEEVLDAFESDLHLHIAEQARKRVFVHAGVVGWRGRAILIPGRSFTGKTTLVAELVRAGATYYSDEYAVLDSRGQVHPFSRPLAIREGDSHKQQKYCVESLGGRSGVKPLPVGLVVVSKYQPGMKWRPRRLSAGQGALALLDNTVSVRRQPEAALGTVQQIVATAPVLKSSRGEATEVIESILNRLN
jgi:hypothetical protein